MTESQSIVHCVRIGHWLSSLGHVASDGKQLPHDGAPPTEQTSRLEDDWAYSVYAMSANAQSHRVTPGSSYSQYSHWGNRSAASVAKQTDKQDAKLYSLDTH